LQRRYWVSSATSSLPTRRRAERCNSSRASARCGWLLSSWGDGQ
jgi:hypothetical protein